MQWIVIILFFIGIVSIAHEVKRDGHIQMVCLNHGYPDYQIWGDGYCIKRVNNSDVVVRADLLED